MLPSLLLSASLLSPAQAGKCDAILKKAGSATGDALVQTFTQLIKCDPKLAEDNFTAAFMTRADEAEVLTQLSLAAIDAQIWTPVWAMPGKIKSYEARDIIADQVGAACVEHPQVITFLQGAYAGLRDVDFQQWDDALLSCEDASLDAWLVEQAENPPDKTFDAKYDVLIAAFVKKKRAAALPHLAKGALDAANSNGPYNTMLQQMEAAVTPPMGEVSPADRTALREALLSVAQGVDAQKAREVANRFATSGDLEAAVNLLPTIYADRVRSGGGFLYGVAAIEAGECKGGVKTAIVHYAEVNEPGKRWDVLPDASGPIKAVKPRLKKCTPEEGPWLVQLTLEPVAGSSAVDDWASSLASQWTQKGYTVTTRQEATVTRD